MPGFPGIVEWSRGEGGRGLRSQCYNEVAFLYKHFWNLLKKILEGAQIPSDVVICPGFIV